MHRILAFALTLSAACLLSGLAQSKEILDGNVLHDKLLAYDRVMHATGQGDDMQKGAGALGFVRGVADTLNLVGQLCTPSGTTGHQLVGITAKYVDDHPDEWHQDAARIVARALEAKFGCVKRPENGVRVPYPGPTSE